MQIRISKLLEMYPYLEVRATYRADNNALTTLIDLDIAIERASLTDSELEVLELSFKSDYTIDMIVQQGKYTKMQVEYRIKKIVEKVGRAYYFPEEVLEEEEDL